MTRAIFSWCLFDWANSAYPTVITTFVFAAYFTKAVIGDATEGTYLWGLATAIAGLTVAIGGPILGTIADLTGRRKLWLALCTLLVITACGGLWTITPDPSDAMTALVLVVIATIGFEFGTIFYNAMLPSLVPAARLGRISGWSWGLGYFGGLSCLAAALIVFVQADTPPFGLDKNASEHIRATCLLVAVWFAIFSLPLFFFVPETARITRPPAALPMTIGTALKTALERLRATLQQARQQPLLLRFLLARMLYTDGLVTLFAFGGIYAAGTFGMGFSEIILFAIALNVTAGLGAAGFGWIDDRLGSKTTIITGIIGLLATGSAVLAIQEVTLFWIAAVTLGIFVGPVQAASRTLMARIAPGDQRGEMFGLFALSGKATAFIGPALVGWITLIADSQRIGMSMILIFWLLGLFLIWGLKLPPRAPENSL